MNSKGMSERLVVVGVISLRLYLFQHFYHGGIRLQ